MVGVYVIFKFFKKKFYDVMGGIFVLGLVDLYVYIESSMMLVCVYVEGVLFNGIMMIFCDSYEIGNVCDVCGIEWMLEDVWQVLFLIFLIVLSMVLVIGLEFEMVGGDLIVVKIGKFFDKWLEVVVFGEKMDFVQVVMGDVWSYVILVEVLKCGCFVCGYIYGCEFVVVGVVSGIMDMYEVIDWDIVDDFLEVGVWIFLWGGLLIILWYSLLLVIKVVMEFGVNFKCVCVCIDDCDVDDLFFFGMDWVMCQVVVVGMDLVMVWSMGLLYLVMWYVCDGEIGGFGYG